MRIAHVVEGGAGSVGEQATRALVEDLCHELGLLGHTTTVVNADALPRLGVDPHPGSGAAALELVVTDPLSEFDVVHVHAARPTWGISNREGVPTLTTLRCPLDAAVSPTLHALSRLPCVATSTWLPARAPMLDWRAVIHDGVSPSRVSFSAVAENYLAFAGPVSRLDRAMAVATEASLPIKLASDGRDRRLFTSIQRYRASDRDVGVEVALSHQQWLSFVRRARALLVTGPGAHCFSPLVVEALAAGTPVVGFSGFEAAELIRPGRSGFIVDTTSDALDVLDDVAVLDREQCRSDFLRRFRSEDMARSYESVYRGLTEHHATTQAG